MTEPLRLLFFGDASSPHTARWCRWFARQGHDVWLATDGEPEGEIAGVTLLRLGAAGLPSALRFPYRLSQARSWVREIRPHLAHGHYVQQYGYLAARCGASAFVVSAWGSDVFRLGERGPRHRAWTVDALTRAALVTVDSADLANAVVHLGVAEDRVVEVVFGVDLEAQERADGASVRRELGLAPDDVLVLSMRNLERLYRPVLVAHATSAAARREPRVRGAIVGAGSLAAEVAQIADGSGGALAALPRQPEERVADFFAAADVFVSVPTSDATSASLLQAMAAGAVPVVSDLPSNREWVKDGGNGVVLTAGDDASLESRLTEVLVRLARDDEYRRTLGTAASVSPRVRETDFASEMRRVEQAYRRIAGEG